MHLEGDWRSLEFLLFDRSYITDFVLILCSNNDAIWHRFRDIITFTVYVTGCHLRSWEVFRSQKDIGLVLLVTFSELAGHFCSLKPFYMIYLGNYSASSAICLHVNRTVHVTCNFNETKDFSRSQPVTYTVHGTRYTVHCNCGSISETMPDRVVITTDH